MIGQHEELAFNRAGPAALVYHSVSVQRSNSAAVDVSVYDGTAM